MDARKMVRGDATSLRRPKGELKAVERACASFKYTSYAIYKLLDDLRSQFELYKSSHRRRVGCYKLVYGHLLRLSPHEIITFVPQKNHHSRSSQDWIAIMVR